MGSFCNSTLKAISAVKNNIKGYKIILNKPHSEECNKLIKKDFIKNNNIINENKDFRNKVFSYLNSLDNYDRKECKKKLQKYIT